MSQSPVVHSSSSRAGGAAVAAPDDALSAAAARPSPREATPPHTTAHDPRLLPAQSTRMATTIGQRQEPQGSLTSSTSCGSSSSSSSRGSGRRVRGSHSSDGRRIQQLRHAHDHKRHAAGSAHSSRSSVAGRGEEGDYDSDTTDDADDDDDDEEEEEDGIVDELDLYCHTSRLYASALPSVPTASPTTPAPPKVVQSSPASSSPSSPPVAAGAGTPVAPADHPGDVTVATLVDPSTRSPLLSADQCGAGTTAEGDDGHKERHKRTKDPLPPPPQQQRQARRESDGMQRRDQLTGSSADSTGSVELRRGGSTTPFMPEDVPDRQCSTVSPRADANGDAAGDDGFQETKADAHPLWQPQQRGGSEKMVSAPCASESEDSAGDGNDGNGERQHLGTRVYRDDMTNARQSLAGRRSGSEEAATDKPRGCSKGAHYGNDIDRPQQKDGESEAARSFPPPPAAASGPYVPPLMAEYDGELLQIIKAYYLRKNGAASPLPPAAASAASSAPTAAPHYQQQQQQQSVAGTATAARLPHNTPPHMHDNKNSSSRGPVYEGENGDDRARHITNIPQVGARASSLFPPAHNHQQQQQQPVHVLPTPPSAAAATAAAGAAAATASSLFSTTDVLRMRSSGTAIHAANAASAGGSGVGFGSSTSWAYPPLPLPSPTAPFNASTSSAGAWLDGARGGGGERDDAAVMLTPSIGLRNAFGRPAMTAAEATALHPTGGHSGGGARGSALEGQQRLPTSTNAASAAATAGGGGALGNGLASGLSVLSSLPSYSSTSFVRAYVSDISLSLEPAIIVSALTAALNIIVVVFLQHHVLDTRDHLGLFLIGSYMIFSSYYMIYYFLERFSGSFRRIASQDKKFYIIGNLIKAGILISITPFACVHLVKIIVFDEWESNILRNLGCIYAIPDFISMIIVRRMRWSTWVHHACVVLFNYFSIMNNYQHENVCRCVVVYAAFSSFAYCVNVLLASRFLGVSVNVARVLSFVALVVYALCCAVNWAWQVYYLRRLLTTGHEHWTVYVYMLLISLVMWDDIVLNKWLLHHARNNAYAASQHLQQHRLRQQQQQQQQQQQSSSSTTNFAPQPRPSPLFRSQDERLLPRPQTRLPQRPY